MACLAAPCSGTLSYTRRDFYAKFLSVKCVFLFSLRRLSEKFFLLKRIQHDIIIHKQRLNARDSQNVPGIPLQKENKRNDRAHSDVVWSCACLLAVSKSVDRFRPVVRREC